MGCIYGFEIISNYLNNYMFVVLMMPRRMVCLCVCVFVCVCVYACAECMRGMCRMRDHDPALHGFVSNRAKHTCVFLQEDMTDQKEGRGF